MPSCREQGATKLCCIKRWLNAGQFSAGEVRGLDPSPCRKTSQLYHPSPKGMRVAPEGTLLPSGQAASEKQPGIALKKSAPD